MVDLPTLYLHIPSKSSIHVGFLYRSSHGSYGNPSGTLGGEPGATDSSWQRNFSLAGREMEGRS